MRPTWKHWLSSTYNPSNTYFWNTFGSSSQEIMIPHCLLKHAFCKSALKSWLDYTEMCETSFTWSWHILKLWDILRLSIHSQTCTMTYNDDMSLYDNGCQCIFLELSQSWTSSQLLIAILNWGVCEEVADHDRHLDQCQHIYRTVTCVCSQVKGWWTLAGTSPWTTTAWCRIQIVGRCRKIVQVPGGNPLNRLAISWIS